MLGLMGFGHAGDGAIVEVEFPLVGGRWADLWIQYGAEHAVLVEVKSSHEDFSAGGLLRQLKDYRQRTPATFKHVTIAVVTDQPAPEPSAWNLLHHEGFHHIYCPADFAAAPRCLP